MAAVKLPLKSYSLLQKEAQKTKGYSAIQEEFFLL